MSKKKPVVETHEPEIVPRHEAEIVQVVRTGGRLVRVDSTLRTNPAAVYLMRFQGKKKSLAAMTGALKRILVAIEKDSDPLAFPWASLRYQDALAIQLALSTKGHSFKTVNHAISALRGVMRECFKLDLIGGDDLKKIEMIRSEGGRRLPHGRMISDDDIAAMFAACEPNRMGLRDAAVLSALYAGGVRRAELCAMTLEKLDRVNRRIVVIGKRNKERVVRLGDAMVEIEAWISARGEEDGPLFHSFDPTHKSKTGGISESGVWGIVRRLADTAGIKPPSPHDLRRTFISVMLKRTGDIATVQDMVGHENIATTKMYDMRGEEEGDAAHLKLTIPRAKKK